MIHPADWGTLKHISVLPASTLQEINCDLCSLVYCFSAVKTDCTIAIQSTKFRKGEVQKVVAETGGKISNNLRRARLCYNVC